MSSKKLSGGAGQGSVTADSDNEDVSDRIEMAELHCGATGHYLTFELRTDRWRTIHTPLNSKEEADRIRHVLLRNRNGLENTPEDEFWGTDLIEGHKSDAKWALGISEDEFCYWKVTEVDGVPLNLSPFHTVILSMDREALPATSMVVWDCDEEHGMSFRQGRVSPNTLSRDRRRIPPMLEHFGSKRIALISWHGNRNGSQLLKGERNPMTGSSTILVSLIVSAGGSSGRISRPRSLQG